MFFVLCGRLKESGPWKSVACDSLWYPWLDRKVMGRDWGDHLGPLRAYLGIHYHAVKTFANSEQVLERNE